MSKVTVRDNSRIIVPGVSGAVVVRQERGRVMTPVEVGEVIEIPGPGVTVVDQERGLVIRNVGAQGPQGEPGEDGLFGLPDIIDGGNF